MSRGIPAGDLETGDRVHIPGVGTVTVLTADWSNDDQTHVRVHFRRPDGRVGYRTLRESRRLRKGIRGSVSA